MHLLMAMRTQLIYQKRRQKHRLSMAKLAIAALTVGSIASGLGVQIKSTPAEAFWQSEIAWNTTASQAKASTSGGRMKGGGFGDDTPPESSDSDTSQDSSGRDSSGRNAGSSSSDRSYNNSYDDEYRNHSSGRSSNNNMGPIEGLVLLGVIGFGAYTAYLKFQAEGGAGSATHRIEPEALPIANQPAAQPVVNRHLSGEITNNVVTITQVQVAMMAQSRHVQRALNQIAAETDLSTKKGLTVGLRETVLTLLRSPETWTHATATTKTVNTKQKAKEYFGSLSMEERSKFDVESLSNVDGQVKRREIIQREDEIASYIVVTLIVGTAHDSAIIDPVMSSEELKTALKRLGSITPDYLMVYEVLWSPQDESDSLTDDELLLNYPKMFQV